MFERVYPPKRSHRASVPTNVVASIVFHALMVGVAGISLPTYVSEQVTEGILYFAPLPVERAAPSVERISYVDVPGGGDGQASAGTSTGIADGPPTLDGQGGPRADEGVGMDGVAELSELPQVNVDSIYFPDEVDNPAAYDPRSAAPAYPDSLQKAGIEGSVTAQFIVDTTGRAADSSLVILTATHPRFAQSVREALPGMLFRPAELTGVKIRQLVQQTFSFRIPSKQSAAGDSTLPTSVPRPVPPLHPLAVHPEW